MSNQKHYCGYVKVVPNDKAVSMKQSGPSTKNYDKQSGYKKVVPNDKAVSTKQSGPSTKNYEITNRIKNYDKQSGRYVHQTSKKSCSSGDYSNRGKTGHKDEFKASSTVRVGDKWGYTEYSKQEKVIRVNYGSVSNSGGSKGYKGSYNSNKYLK